MALELWLALVVANAALLLTPGPAMLLIVGTALERGTRAAVTTLLGVLIGAQTAMLISLLGVGALLAASATAFTALKVLGACYLVYLAVRTWRAPPATLQPANQTGARRAELVSRGFLVSLLNPKAIVFYMAFLPQFLDPSRPLVPQLVVIALTFVVQGIVFDGGYALLAGRARRLLLTPSIGRLFNRAAAACLMAAGLLTLTLRRSG